MPQSRVVRFRGIAAGILSGVLLALSFPPASVALIAWVALVPLFLHFLSTRGEQVVLPFFAFGVGFFTVGLFWLAPVLTPLGPLLLSFVLSVLFILPVSLAARVLLRGNCGCRVQSRPRSRKRQEKHATPRLWRSLRSISVTCRSSMSFMAIILDRVSLASIRPGFSRR